MNIGLLFDPRKFPYDIVSRYSARFMSALFTLQLERAGRGSLLGYFMLSVKSIAISFTTVYFIYPLIDNFLGIKISRGPWLEAASYALGLTVLIDVQIAGRKTKRIYNGAIIGIMVGASQTLQTAYFDAHLTAFDAVLAFTSFSSGFAVGWYFPVTVAAALIRTKGILNDCYPEM